MVSLEQLRSERIGGLTTEAEFLPDNTPISKIIGRMRNLYLYEVFIESGEKVGIVNVRSIMEATDILSTKAGSLAVSPPRVYGTDSVGKVSSLMSKHRLRCIPVWEDGKPIGQITALSIMRLIVDYISEKVKASHVMTEDPTTIEETFPASKARNLMIRRRIDHLPVVDGRQPTGMLTSSHLVFHLLPAERLGSTDRVGEALRRLNFPVKEIMDTEIELSPLNEPVVNLLRDMIKLRKTYSLIGLWGELQGIVTYRDFMKLLETRESSTEIAVSILGLPDDPFESEVAKTKFTRVVSLLRRAYPRITEARATIKTSSFSARRGRKHYEVTVTIRTPRDLFSYSEKGWDLAEVFDVLSDRMKRLLTQRKDRR